MYFYWAYMYSTVLYPYLSSHVAIAERCGVASRCPARDTRYPYDEAEAARFRPGGEFYYPYERIGPAP